MFDDASYCVVKIVLTGNNTDEDSSAHLVLPICLASH
jgi:hypothetical protein